MTRLVWALALAVSCTGDGTDTTENDDTGEAVDTSDTSDTGDASDTGDTSDTSDTGLACDIEPRTCEFGLVQDASGGPIVITTAACWTIRVDLHTITLTDPWQRNKVESWSTAHENLNGKHIKDWLGERRTIVLGDGALVTMHAQGPQAVADLTSVYDGAHLRRIDNATNTVALSHDDASTTSALEAAEADGEASSATPRDNGGLHWENTYTQAWETDGTPLEKVPVPAAEPLGTSGGCPAPNNVDDYYDDPRFVHT